MQTDSIEPATRTRSSFQLTYSRERIKRPQKEHKINKNYKIDPPDDKEGIQTHPVENIVDPKSTFRPSNPTA